MSFRETTENCPIEPDDRSPIVKLRCKFGANLFSGGELIRGLQGRKLRDLERAREKTRPIDTGCNPCVSGGAIFADFRIRTDGENSPPPPHRFLLFAGRDVQAVQKR
ncbi:hypothetical protein MTP99_009858 [Tenebrio molitor]|jgi:hypothetical protein|nr:hypothetical protein MTP99_009858 [Tenebrio molitor]